MSLLYASEMESGELGGGISTKCSPVSSTLTHFITNFTKMSLLIRVYQTYRVLLMHFPNETF